MTHGRFLKRRLNMGDVENIARTIVSISDTNTSLNQDSIVHVHMYTHVHVVASEHV